MPFILTAIFLAIGAVQLVPLIQKEQRKTAITYAVVLGLAYLLSLLITLGVPLPNVSTAIHQFIRGLFNLSKEFGAP